MKDKIIIVDNFFTKEEFNILYDNLSKISFEPTGNYGFGHGFKVEKSNEWLFKKIKNNFFPKQNLKPLDISFRYRHNNTKILTHVDKHEYNFIGYLKGKELMYNGTGFYNYKKNLDRYVGFIENRVLFFKGDTIYHTDLQALGESSPRYTINIFYGQENI